MFTDLIVHVPYLAKFVSIDTVGFAAGILTSINLLPQIIHSLQTKEVEDISLGMYILYDVGLSLWVLYGILLGSWPIMSMDGFAFLCSLIMTYLKIKFNTHTG